MRNNSIKSKLILSSILICLIPTVIISSTLIAVMYDWSYKKALALADSSASQLTGNYITLLRSYQQQVQDIARYSIIEEYLRTEFNNSYENFDYYIHNIHPLVYNRASVNEGFCIRIYHNRNNWTSYSMEFNNLITREKETEWYKKMQHKSSFWMSGGEQVNMFQPILSYYEIVRERTPSHGIIFVASISLSTKAFTSYINEETKAGKHIYLLDPEDRIVVASDESRIGANARDIDLERVTLADVSGNERIADNGIDYIAVSKTLSNDAFPINGFRLIYLVPYGNVFSDFLQITLLITVLAVICLIIALFPIVRMANQITGGLSALALKMKKVTEGDFENIVNSTTQIDTRNEIELLSIAYENMMARIDTLINKVHEAEINIRDSMITRQQIQMEKRDAEIAALQHQINPHYLFNTLEAIRMNMVLKHDNQTAEIIEIFASSFSEYMDISKQHNSIRDEIKFIKNYIRIQNYRFGDKIDLQTYVDDDVLNLVIPKLMIQPLIENAAYHGIEPKPDKGSIILEINRQTTTLVITVTDDGAGMDEKTLANLNDIIFSSAQYHEHHSSAKIALKNIYDRIKLLYGKKGDMKINSKPGVGTEIKLIIPIHLIENAPSS